MNKKIVINNKNNLAIMKMVQSISKNFASTTIKSSIQSIHAIQKLHNQQHKLSKKNEKHNQKQKQLTLEVEDEDIDVFYTTSSKALNDKTNKLRETIIETILHMNSKTNTHFSHEIYGQKWKNTQLSLHQFIKTNFGADEEIGRGITLQKMAGRMFNYDFLLKTPYRNDIKLEFKYNVDTISKLPQILSLPVSNSAIHLFKNIPSPTYPEYYFNTFLDEMSIKCYSSYTDFYYDNFLDEYLHIFNSGDGGGSSGSGGDGCDFDGLEKPQKDVYLKHVQKVNYNCLSFFELLKENEEINKIEKFEIVKKSIAEYLHKYGETIDIPVFEKKIMESQSGKAFMLYKKEQFIVETFDSLHLMDFVYKGIKNNNTIVVGNAFLNFNILLRWRNHMGILNPAFQIGVSKV